jgi:hypothetical protein
VRCSKVGTNINVKPLLFFKPQLHFLIPDPVIGGDFFSRFNVAQRFKPDLFKIVIQFKFRVGCRSVIVQRAEAQGDGRLVTIPLKVVIVEVGLMDDLSVIGRKQDDGGQFNGGPCRNLLAGENAAATFGAGGYV